MSTTPMTFIVLRYLIFHISPNRLLGVLCNASASEQCISFNYLTMNKLSKLLIYQTNNNDVDLIT